MKLINLHEEKEIGAFATKAAEAFRDRQAYQTWNDKPDLVQGELLSIRWNPWTVAVVKLDEGFTPRLYDTDSLGVGRITEEEVSAVPPPSYARTPEQARAWERSLAHECLMARNDLADLLGESDPSKEARPLGDAIAILRQLLKDSGLVIHPKGQALEVVAKRAGLLPSPTCKCPACGPAPVDEGAAGVTHHPVVAGGGRS